MPLLTKLRQFSRERLPLILGIYIVLQPLLDILTALCVEGGLPITAGVVVRALFMALTFLYVVFVSKFPGKRACLAVLGVLLAYLAVFMAYMFSLGGLSLCLHNLQEVVKTFFTPFVLVFLYTIYREYGFVISTRSIAWAGALYASVILLAAITDSSFTSYANSGYGYNGWFYAANEIGCIIALTAPVTVYYCMKQLPTVTKKTWWRGVVIAWTLAAIAFSANFIGTKIVFAFTLVYCIAAFIWTLVRRHQEPSKVNSCRALILAVLSAVIVVIYFVSPLQNYLNDVYGQLIEIPSDDLATYWPGEIQAASDGTWLQQLIADVPLVQRIDSILSRRLYTSAPSVEVFIEGGPLAKLLGVGYANAPSYSRDVTYMIEMDPPSIFIRHGIIGFAIYVLPYFAFILYAIVQFFKHPLKRLADLKYCTYLYTTLAAFAIALLAGHALVSPAVATFLLAVSFKLWVLNQERDSAPNRT